ncbi:hypothetical protein SRB521_02051 [Intestinimonas butyriciproducens]|nr:hypothetical protein SRB521_02051 [Intestinimonas butyriciproducens]
MKLCKWNKCILDENRKLKVKNIGYNRRNNNLFDEMPNRNFRRDDRHVRSGKAERLWHRGESTGIYRR